MRSVEPFELDDCRADDRIKRLRSRACVACRIGRRRSESMERRPTSALVVKFHAPLPFVVAVPSSHCAIEYVTLLLASAVPLIINSFATRAVSPVENWGDRRRRVDRDRQGARGRASIAGRIRGSRGQAVRAICERRRSYSSMRRCRSQPHCRAASPRHRP